MNSKATVLELVKDGEGEPGEVRALFATMNVIDHDFDITVPGAFRNGEQVRIASYGHKLAELPVGRGAIFADDEHAIMKGRFFLDTTAGKDTYTTVKEMADLQEWSYEYDILDSEPGTQNGVPVQFLKSLKVHGVTPVYLGAGIDTQTLDIKSFLDHGEDVAKVVADYVERAKNRAAVRAKEGRTLSTLNRNRLSALVESLASVATDIQQLLDDTDPDREKDSLARLRNQFLRTLGALNGV
jgi:Caudovirus prohead serine protease